MSLDYDKFKKERLSGTKIEPYHMITAVTQRSINKQFAKMHQVNSTLRKLTLNSADPDDEYSTLEADLCPPTIELRLNTENRIVIFCLKIKRATLKYLKIKGRKVLEETMGLPSCVLALSVNLTFEGVDFKNLPKEIQDRLKVKNDYSVRQLFIDFTSASLARLDKQRTTIQDHITDANAQANFNIFMEEYFTILAKKKNDHVPHYLPLATTEGRKNYAMSTVPPTDFTFQNMPFVVSDTDNGKPSDDNMLIYLQMTGNEPIPRKLLSISTGEESLLAFLQMTEDGVMPRSQLPTVDSKWAAGIDTRVENPVVAISKNKFLEKCIISKLTDINKRSTWTIDNAWVEATLLPPKVKYELSGHLGWKNAKESDLTWVPLSFEDVPSDARVKVKGTGAWYHFKHADYRAQESKMVYEVSQRATTENFIFVPGGIPPSGKTRIYIFGRTLVDFHTRMDFTSSSGWAMNQWSTEIIFDSSKPEEPITVTTEDVVRGKTTVQTDDEELGAKVIAPVKQQLEKFEFSLKDLGTHLKGALQEDWPFFIPVRGGPYYIDRAFFGKGLDLICEMKQRAA